MKKIFVFLFFWLCALAFYWRTAGAGFVADTIGWIQIYQVTGWQGIPHAFGDRALHYVYQTVFFLVWKCFGLNGYLWMLLFTALHAMVATLAYSVFKLLFATENITRAGLIAFSGALIFLLSPYLTEPLVWYACIHYFVCSILLLAAFRYVLVYLEDSRKKFITIFYVLYVIALFSLEISFAFPILLLVFFLFWPDKIFNQHKRADLIKMFVAPTFVLVLMYLGLSKLLKGSVVGHYGASTHLNADVFLLTANFSKYVAKIFMQAQFWPLYKDKLYAIFETKWYGAICFAVLAVLAVWFIWKHKKLGSQSRIAILLGAFFIVGLLPVLNLFVTTIVNVECDRFTYFAMIFAGQLISFTLITFLRIPGVLLTAIFLFFECTFLLYNTESWQSNRMVNQSLVKDFRWYHAKKIYLLNMPDNYRGTYFYRGYPPDNSFDLTLQVTTGGALKPKLQEVLLYNMNAVTDSVYVEKVSDNELNVVLGQWGNWWWRKGIGANDFATEDFSVKIDEWSHSYRIRFNQKEPGTVYLYQCGGQWREVAGF